MSVMVVGGAGYIGAHVVHLLLDKGERVVVVDDLSYGNPSRIGDAKLIKLDVAEESAVEILTDSMIDYDVTAVIHFAARKQVGESVEKPLWYYQQNVGGLVNVLRAMKEANVRQMVFSSSAAVYGQPPVEVVSEDAYCHPINPYGETKLIGEWIMADCERSWGLNWAGLRYFNVAGAGSDALGDPAILNLIPMVFERLSKGDTPKIFGDDYPTPDGTCIRDYIHVQDLAEAHLVALDYLGKGGNTEHVFNVGTGKGTSVKEIIDAVAEVSGLDFEPEIQPRRAGDPAQLIGQTNRIEEVLGWKAKYDVREIVESAWSAWQAGPNRIG